jgi:hypothetical protein
MSLRHRLGRLEGRAEKARREWEMPVEVRVLLKESARHQAAEEGCPLPSYTPEELANMQEPVGPELEALFEEIDAYVEALEGYDEELLPEGESYG